MKLLRFLPLLLVATNLSAAPTIPVGVIEGFYGAPWSHQDRLDVLEFMGGHDLDLYIYAPKDDPLHRASWRDPYAQEEMAEFRELVTAAQQNDVNFCFAVSPGSDMTYSDPDEQQILLDKMMSLHADGVRHFALFLDDINVERMAEPDRARFDTAVEAQMHLANTLQEMIIEREPDAWFLICPTVYLGTDDTDYWRTLREQLNPDIHVVWTGREVVGPTITDADLDAITHHLGREPFLWENYPVNDVWRHRLHLGPLVGRTESLPERLTGYASNPMNEAHASFIALATISDFLHDPTNYDPESSWQRAIEEVGGPAANSLLVLAENSRRSSLADTYGSPASVAVEAYLASPTADTHTALEREIARMAWASDHLTAHAPPALASEISPWIGALGDRAEVLDATLAFLEGDLSAESRIPLVRWIDDIRNAPIVVAEGPTSLLFEYAVGMTPGFVSAVRPSFEVTHVNPHIDTPYGGDRGENELIIYTPDYGEPTTGTNQYGNEATIIDSVVTRVVRLTGNSEIPANGFIVSGHGRAADWVAANLEVNTRVEFTEDEVRWQPVADELQTPQQRLRYARVNTLGAIGRAVLAGAPDELLNELRAILREVDAAAAAEGGPDANRVRAVMPRLARLEFEAWSGREF